MVRRSIVGAATLAAVVLLAAPAGAKGIQYAKFTGPGLPKGGIVLRGDLPQLWRTGIEEGDKSVTPFSGAKGPAYHAVYVLDWAPGQPVHQTLYPYAAGGPRSYTPVNQSVAGNFLDYGWYQGTPDLLRLLVRHGFPKHAPALTAPPATVGSTSAWPAWSWILVALGIGGALLVVASRQRRRALA